MLIQLFDGDFFEVRIRLFLVFDFLIIEIKPFLRSWCQFSKPDHPHFFFCRGRTFYVFAELFDELDFYQAIFYRSSNHTPSKRSGNTSKRPRKINKNHKNPLPKNKPHFQLPTPLYSITPLNKIYIQLSLKRLQS